MNTVIYREYIIELVLPNFMHFDINDNNYKITHIYDKNSNKLLKIEIDYSLDNEIIKLGTLDMTNFNITAYFKEYVAQFANKELIKQKFDKIFIDITEKLDYIYYFKFI